MRSILTHLRGTRHNADPYYTFKFIIEHTNHNLLKFTRACGMDVYYAQFMYPKNIIVNVRLPWQLLLTVMTHTKQIGHKSTGGTIHYKQNAIKVVCKRTSCTDKLKKPHRNRPATGAPKEIYRYQKSTEFLIRKLSFQSLTHEFTQGFRLDLRFQSSSVCDLQ